MRMKAAVCIAMFTLILLCSATAYALWSDRVEADWTFSVSGKVNVTVVGLPIPETTQEEQEELPAEPAPEQIYDPAFSPWQPPLPQPGGLDPALYYYQPFEPLPGSWDGHEQYPVQEAQDIPSMWPADYPAW